VSVVTEISYSNSKGLDDSASENSESENGEEYF
jgi:hypothetical protein